MAYSTINKSTTYHNTKIYTGNNSTQAVTGLGHQPDWVWIKNNTDTDNHNSYDIIRGVQERLDINEQTASTTKTNGLTSFDSDGFTVGNAGEVNGGSDEILAWTWAAGGSGSANTDGATSSTVSANTTSGFSIVKYSGSGVGNTTTVGHGLGKKPDVIFIKHMDSGRGWIVYNSTLGAENKLDLDTASNKSDSSAEFNDTEPTSTVFTVGTGGDTNSTGDKIAYCFADTVGFSKSGTYKPHQTTDGPFVNLGFKPRWILFKGTVDSRNWILFDSEREQNEKNNALKPNTTAIEATEAGLAVDFLSNGFKIRGGSGQVNTNDGVAYTYLAFGQTLVGSNNIPCNAV